MFRTSSTGRKEAIQIEGQLESSLNEILALRSDYRLVLQDIRGSICRHDELPKIIQRFYTGKASSKVIESILSEANKNLRFKAAVLKYGGQYIDYNDAQKAISVGSNIYIMYFTADMKSNIDCWETNCQIIMRLLTRNPGDYLVAVAEYQLQELNFAKARVVFYRQGKVSTEDMQEKMDLVDQCFAKYDSTALDESGCHQPADRRLVRIPCPGKSCDHDISCDWTCYRCRGPLEYWESYIYCECGRTSANSFIW